MESVLTQIRNGVIVCPVSKKILLVNDNVLLTEDGTFQYSFNNGVPNLINTSQQAAYLSENDGSMEKEYTITNANPSETGLKSWLNSKLVSCPDYRSVASIDAFNKIFDNQSSDAVCIAVGGGPQIHHPKLVNINIAPFNNVHVVADAYALPYADSSVDAIYCEAVIEHLEFPEKAVIEMYRVLKPGGQVYASTPFLQYYHGYPNHFQNFTITGHERLFIRSGFEIINSGVCVGPTYVLADFVNKYFEILPSNLLTKGLSKILALCFLFLRKHDNKLNNNVAKAVDMASTTFLHAIK